MPIGNSMPFFPGAASGCTVQLIVETGLGSPSTGRCQQAKSSKTRDPFFTNRRCGATSPVRSVPDPPASTAPRAREEVKTHARFDATGEAGDADTNDLLIAFSRAVDKQLWFLEAHVSHGE
jgi:starvation-inducible DNA-binding protein